MDLEGYARSELSKKLTSCQRSLKNLFKRSLSLTPPSHRPGVARQPGSTDPALSSVLGARAPLPPLVRGRPALGPPRKRALRLRPPDAASLPRRRPCRQR